MSSSGSLTGVLQQEHEVILRALAVLDRVGGQLAAGAAVAPETLPTLANFFQSFADRLHHAKEETHLFPAMVNHGIPKEGGPVGVMLQEHDEGRALVRTFAEGNPATALPAIRSFVRLLREHIMKENEILFPMAEQVIPQPEQRTMSAAFEAAEAEVLPPAQRDKVIAELERLEAATQK